MIKKLIKRFIIPILIFTLISFTTAGDVSELAKYKMYVKGIKTLSTAPYYLVIKVKNKNTNETKELCTEAPFLSGAIEREYNYDYSLADSIAISQKDRYFEFVNESALWNIDFELYNAKELQNYKNTINLEAYLDKILNGDLKSKNFRTGEHARKYQRMFAHLLFNEGIMTRRGCIAGNIVYFEIYKED